MDKDAFRDAHFVQQNPTLDKDTDESEVEETEMKKKPIMIVSIVFAVILLVLFLPIPKGTYDDGGTRDYDALLYKVVVWNKLQAELNEDGSGGESQMYHKTSVFWFPDNHKNIDELWKIERSNR